MFLKKIVISLILFFILIPTIKTQEENSVKEIKAAPNKELVKPEKIKNNLKKKKDKTKEDKEKKDIYLNFENTELSNFINYMSELKKINLIPDKTLQGVKVSLTIRDPLTVDGAWKVFLTILEMGGFSIVKKGDVQVIIPKAQKSRQPLPSYLNVPLKTLPDSDINLRYVTFLQNISVTEVHGLLKGMLSLESVVVPYPEVNGMIITDKSYNIKAAMKVINELDQTGLQESVVVMKLKRANATDIKALFESLIQQPQGSPLARLLGKQAESTLEYFSPTTRIIAEERTNSLILLGNRKSIKKIEDFVVNHLDTELKAIESPLHIYELQHTDAEQIKGILEAVTEPSGEKAKYGAVRGGVKYFKKMNFQVDKDGNRLLVSSTDKQDWRLLKKTIQDLDKPQPQVAIETLIVTINMEDEKVLGGALRNKTEGQIGKGVNAQSPTFAGTILKGEDQGAAENNLLGNMFEGLTGGLGSTLFTFGQNHNIWGIFKALKSQTNASILSQPFFTVENKQKAHILVGETLNVEKERTGTDFIGYHALNAATRVDITPQINLDGIIRLNIDIEFSEFTERTLGNKNIKILKTDVSVADGQVLVLGGFIKTKVTENLNKTPLLGDIPILGWLFKNKKRNISKDYIFIFMSPTIIKPRQTPGTNLYTRIKLHQATNNIEDAVETKKTRDPIHNWFFNPEGEDYSHKVVDFANARYQPTTVDIKNDPYYRATLKNGLKDKIEEDFEEIKEKVEKAIEDEEEKLLAQKRQQLKELISAQPILRKKKIEPKKIKIDTQKRDEFKRFLSEKPVVTQNNKKEINPKIINSQKRRELKELLQANPSLASNIKINVKNNRSYGSMLRLSSALPRTALPYSDRPELIEGYEQKARRKKRRQPRKLKSRRLA